MEYGSANNREEMFSVMWRVHFLFSNQIRAWSSLLWEHFSSYEKNQKYVEEL